MSSLYPITLSVRMNVRIWLHIMEDQTLDADDIFEFIIHNGAYPATIYAL
jgi:hypothetical protein